MNCRYNGEQAEQSRNSRELLHKIEGCVLSAIAIVFSAICLFYAGIAICSSIAHWR